MSWSTDLVTIVRVLVNDIALPQSYTDDYLKQVIITAGYSVDAEVEFAYTYTYDISELTISPDPMTNNDSVFIALIPLKAACILNVGEFKKALGQGIKVRDGDSSVDTSVSFRGYRDILELGPCASYNRLKWTILASSGVGKAVLGPYRTPTGNALSTIQWYYDQFANVRRDR